MHPRLSIVASDNRMMGEAIFAIAEQVAPTFARAFTRNSKPNLYEIVPRIQAELCADEPG